MTPPRSLTPACVALLASFLALLALVSPATLEAIAPGWWWGALALAALRVSR